MAAIEFCILSFALLFTQSRVDHAGSDPDAQGAVTEVCEQAFRLERKVGARHEAVIVRIDSQTEIFRAEDNGRVKAEFSDVKVGQGASIWILRGSPVQLTFPIQVTASLVVIEAGSAEGIPPRRVEPLIRQLPGKAFIEIEKSGGFAGGSKVWRMTTEQKVVSSLGEQELSNEAFWRIQALAHILMRQCADSDSLFPPLPPCDDCYLYRVRIQRSGRIKTLHCYEVSPGMADLKELIKLSAPDR